MARKDKTHGEAHGETPVANEAPASPVAFGLKYKDWSLTPSGDVDGAVAEMAGALGIAPAGVKYLLQNGFTQSLTDAAAFGKDEKEGKTVEELSAMAASARTERFNDIVAGTVGTRIGGTRLVGVEKVARDMAIEELRAIASVRNAKLPTKADELNPLIERHMTKHGARINAAAQAKVDMLASLGAELASED